MSLIEWSGDAAEGRDVLARIRDELKPAVSDLSVVPFLFMQTITDDLFGHGLRTYIKAGFAGDLPDGLIDALLERAVELQSPISQVELLALGGAIARVDPGATAFGFRKARWLINIPATWRDAADDEREIAWARATYAAVRPFLSEGTYVNFMGDDEDEGAAGAYGRTIERLQRVKAAYDPDNIFRLNQNITPVSAAAQIQRRLWGTDPRAWADLAEGHNQPLFEAVLDAAGAGPGTRLLDVGCGSGLTLELAARRGAVPSGLDISPGLLGIARARLPAADLRDGDMEFLPFGDAAFDAVVGVNAFQFAGDPRRALREAARVTRPGGRVVASLFAAPERSQGTVVHEAMSALVPPEQAGDHAPYALSAPGNLEAALASAGLRVMDHGEVVCWWRYAGLEDAVRALLCSAGGARAVQAAGEQAVRDVLERALAPFQDPKTGTVALRNTFRWVAAVRLAGLRRSRPFVPGHPFLHGQRGEQVVQPGDEGGRVVDPGAEGEHRLVEQHGGPVCQARVVRQAVEPFHQRVRRIDLEHRLARQTRAAQPHGQADVGLGLVGHQARGGGGQPARHADVPEPGRAVLPLAWPAARRTRCSPGRAPLSPSRPPGRPGRPGPARPTGAACLRIRAGW